MRTRSSSNLVGESSPNPTTSNPKRHNRKRSKQPFILEESPAWDRYKDLLRTCPHHGFTKLHQLDTFYNALNPANQESLNSAAGGNLLERRTQDVLMIIENKSKCLVADGNTFPEFRDNIQGYVSVAAVNYNQGNFDYRPPGSGPFPSNIIANLKVELKAITTRSGLALDGPFILMPPPFINPEEDEHVEETLTDLKLGEDPLHPNIPYPSRMYKQKQQDKDEIQIHKFWQMFKQLHINITFADALILISKYQKMLKALLSNKEKLLKLANTPLNENCSAVILKKLPEKLRDPGKFLIPCGFSEIKCKALADLGASINLMPLSSDPRVPLVLGRPFLRTTRALIDVHGEEMILCDGNEILTLNMRHDTSSYSNQPQKESINMINIYNDSCEDYLKDLFATNHLIGNPTFSSHTDLTSLKVINPLSGSTTSSSPNHLLEEFVDELALITFPSRNNDLPFDIKSDLREIEYFLNHDPTKEMDSILEDSVDEDNLANPNVNLVDTIPEMFTDTHTLDYSSPPLYDDVYDDPFDSKEDKIKESKLLIDELDPFRSSDFLPSPEYDSFLFEDFSKVDSLPSTNNKEKVFNLGVLIYENLSKVTVQVTPDKNVNMISNSSLILEDFDPPLYELPFHKEVLWLKTILLFSFENEEKVFKPGILTSK
nr:reverse transcriptase domain-containing protein [Tanacetum cinerariifolium]